MSLESQPISTVDSTTEFPVPVGMSPQAPAPSDAPESTRAVESLHAVEHVSLRLARRYRPHPNKKTKLALSTLLIATTFAAAAVTLSWMHFSQAAAENSLANSDELANGSEDSELSDLRHVQSQTPEKEKYRPHEELGIDLELRPVSDALVTAEDLIVGPVSDAPPVHVIPPQLSSSPNKQPERTLPEATSFLASTSRAEHVDSNPTNEPEYALTEAEKPRDAGTNPPTTPANTAPESTTVIEQQETPAHIADSDNLDSISDDLDSLIQSYRECYLSLKTDGGKHKRYGRDYYASVAELCVWVNVANQVPREVENLVREIATDKDLRSLVKSASYSWIRWPQRASDGVIVAGELAGIDMTDSATMLEIKTGHKGTKTVTVKAVNGCDVQIGGQIMVLGMISPAEKPATTAPTISGYVLGN